MNDELTYLPLAHLRKLYTHIETFAARDCSEYPSEALPIGFLTRAQGAPWIEVDVAGHEFVIARKDLDPRRHLVHEPVPAMAVYELGLDGVIVPDRVA